MAVDQLEKKASTLSLGDFRNKQSEKSIVPEAEGSGKAARLQLVLPEQSFQRLESIKEATEATSYAEVLRHSLRIYEGLLAERDKGSALIVRRPNGEELTIPLHFFVR